ncbi:hypothetical protein KZP23_19415 [Echinicola marina]|uniref:hypothetical protein n=1 Tax=Echinicola marina TaxID=2859768 RepID=UPI001CF6FA14|nr:hypothetical protein [Echinicola marina]UCS92815.1 hypothetical protein KZP23_19415 [Echinicola marina]
MEEIDLFKLGLFIEEDIVLIPEEAKELLLARKFNKYKTDLPSQNSKADEPLASQGEGTLAVENNESSLSATIDYEGEFGKGLMVIYQGNLLPDELKDFLLKILRAVSHSLKDIALVSSTHLESLDHSAIKKLNPHKVLVFGRLNHPLAHLKEANYEVTTEKDVEYIFADDLQIIFEEENLKRKLWKSLQVFFNINK